MSAVRDVPAQPRGSNMPEAAGIGLRHAHYREFLDGTPRTAWVEVHAENYFGDGGWDLHVLESVRSRYPVSVHGVALSLGSADRLSETHLAALARLVRRVEPVLVSEHLSWSAFGDRHHNDLLPLPRTREALERVVGHIAFVQERLGRRILVENVSTYLEFRNAGMGEPEFIGEVCRRAGCALLLDVNNLYVNAMNHGFDPVEALDRFGPVDVAEIHVAGHAVTDECLIDDHGSRVAEAVWSLYRQALERHGPVPTLVEWDTDVPALEVLLAEAARADRIADTVRQGAGTAAHHG